MNKTIYKLKGYGSFKKVVLKAWWEQYKNHRCLRRHHRQIADIVYG